MDLDNAIAKHAEWKMTFRSAIENQTTLDVQTLCKDNGCELGKWLHGEAKSAYGNRPEYSKCVDAHAAFHREAGAVAATINARHYDQAKKMIATGSAYSTASSTAGAAIVSLQRITNAVK